MIAYEIQLRYAIQDKIQSETENSVRDKIQFEIKSEKKKKIVRKKIVRKKFVLDVVSDF